MEESKINNISAKPANQCSGCTACETICPKDAIYMASDSMGFFYPKVDDNRCTNCGLCLKMCPFKKPAKQENETPPFVYALRSKKDDDLLRSQSGGAFYLIAKTSINNDFIVYGAGYNSAFDVEHHHTKAIDGLNDFRGSKYAQSDIRGIFRRIREQLSENEKVLFSGTPCQVAGLLSIIPKKLQTNLRTIDIICHGVPSPIAWKSYLGWLEKKYKSNITKANFRNKEFGWHSCRETFVLENGLQITRDSFRHFLMSKSHFCTRLSCSNCPFTSMQRVSDLTIGDFWGWEKFHSEWNDNKGISLLLVNTEMGKRIIAQIANEADMIESSVEECQQPQLNHPISIDTRAQAKFISLLESGNFSKIMKLFADEGLKYKFYRLKKRYIG